MYHRDDDDLGHDDLDDARNYYHRHGYDNVVAPLPLPPLPPPHLVRATDTDFNPGVFASWSGRLAMSSPVLPLAAVREALASRADRTAAGEAGTGDREREAAAVIGAGDWEGGEQH